MPRQSAVDLHLSGGASDREKSAALEKSKHDALAQILSTEEMTEYDLRTSNTTAQLRYRLSAFDPSEAEFRAIFPFQRAFDEQFNPSSRAPEDPLARRTAQNQLTENIKAVLGADRAAEYDRDTDYNYIQTAQLVSRLQLPPETSSQLADLQKNLEQRINALRADRSLSEDQRAQQLSGLQSEATAKITSALGVQGAEAYKHYGGGWMQQLEPHPAKRQ